MKRKNENKLFYICRINMPEGPEVKRTSEELNEELKSLYLTSLIVSEKGQKLVKNKMPYDYGKIVKIVSYGKKIIFCLNYLAKSFYLVSSLGMEGKWRYESKDLKHVCATLQLSEKKGKFLINKREVYYDDTRRFGSLEFTEDLNFLNSLGPDILSEAISVEDFKSRFDSQKGRQICQSLLDQSVISGVGNYLKADILYSAKIKPDRLCSEIKANEWSALHSFTYSLAKESYHNYGLTIKSYFTPSLKKGSYKPRVYGREEDDKGNEVVKETFKDGRTTHWVPNVQK